MLKVVIFDLDDTLYSYAKCNSKANKELVKFLQINYNIDADKAEKIISEAKCIVKKRLSDVAAAHNRMLYMQTICELLGCKPAINALEMYNIYWNCMLDEMELFPYVKTLFSLLEANGIKIAILSDLTAHIQHRKLQKLGIVDKIDYLVTSEEAGEEKPSTKMFGLMLNKANCDKDEMIMIGDSLQKDVEGARQYGIPAIWFSQDDVIQDTQMNGTMLLEYFQKQLLGGCVK